MITRKRIYNVDELRKIQTLAKRCKEAVGIRSEDGSIVVDAKSFLGLFALDFTKPVLVVSDNIEYHKRIAHVGETLEYPPLPSKA